MWLADLAKKSAQDIKKDCKYSSKPVVIPIPSKKTSYTGSIGISLLFKKKNVVVKISRDFHEKLGRPNLEKYAEALVKNIKKRIREEKDESQKTK
jgi:hypothetical protein